jgi:phospholipid/cholesterol/gamma-HCH transport system substrate-binding protein
MKISNETKVGVLAAITITLLILGFNFLKGKKLFEKKDIVYAVFDKVDALSTSDAIKINGLQVGNVADMVERDPNISAVIVGLNIKKKVNIPKNSYAVIEGNPLGSSSINIILGTSTEYVQDGDTISTNPASGLLSDLKGALGPTVTQVNGTLKTLDSLLEQVSTIFDPKTKSNVQNVVANLALSTASLNAMLNAQTGALAKSLNNLNSFTANLKNNNDSITMIVGNVEKLTHKLSDLELQQTVTKFQDAADKLNATLAKVNSNNGTLGLLMNDPKLYNNLNATSNSLNILLQDLRLHPKRYINVSVFGKKDKTQPLMVPLSDTATKVPQQ